MHQLYNDINAKKRERTEVIGGTFDGGIIYGGPDEIDELKINFILIIIFLFKITPSANS